MASFLFEDIFGKIFMKIRSQFFNKVANRQTNKQIDRLRVKQNLSDGGNKLYINTRIAA